MELQKFVDTHGSALGQHSSRRTILTLAYSIYENDEDGEAAINIANTIIADGRRPRSHTSGDTSLPPGLPTDVEIDLSSRTPSTDHIYHNVAMRLKENQKKFNSDLGEGWIEYVDEYEQVSLD